MKFTASSPLVIAAALMVSSTQAIAPKQWVNIDNSQTAGQVDTAKDAACGINSEYKFGAYRGSENALILEFEGGGFCQDHASCISNIGLANGGSCTKNELPVGWSVNDEVYQGLPKHDDERNPLKNWNHIFVPYCTCDFHVGSQAVPLPIDPADPSKGTDTFNFNGFNNAKFVLEWVAEKYKAEFGQRTKLPKKILVTGCSAGAYASNLYLDYINQVFGGSSEIYTFIDSGFGSLAGLKAALPLFGSEAFTSSEILTNTLLAEGSKQNVAEIVAAVADKYPGTKHASFSFINDILIPGPELLEDQVRELEAADRCNVNSIIHPEPANNAPPTHCIITFPGFYTITLPNSENKLLTEYLDDFVNDRCVETYVPETLATEKNIVVKDYCSETSECADNSSTRVGMSAIMGSIVAFVVAKLN